MSTRLATTAALVVLVLSATAIALTAAPPPDLSPAERRERAAVFFPGWPCSDVRTAAKTPPSPPPEVDANSHSPHLVRLDSHVNGDFHSGPREAVVEAGRTIPFTPEPAHAPPKAHRVASSEADDNQGGLAHRVNAIVPGFGCLAAVDCLRDLRGTCGYDPCAPAQP